MGDVSFNDQVEIDLTAVRKAKWLSDLREVTDFLDIHRDLIPDDGHSGLQFNCQLWAAYNPDASPEKIREDVLDQMRPLVQDLKDGAKVGDVLKLDSDYFFGFRRAWGSHKINVQTHAAKTCEMVESGEYETVETVEIPDAVREAYREKVTRPVMVKKCPPLFTNEDVI
jgi:hypothetical protein